MNGGPLLPLLARLPSATRRELLRWSALWTGAALLGCKSEARSPDTARKSTSAVEPAGRVLSADEWRSIEAVTARILPSEEGAGAREALVVRFIDRQLETRSLAPLVPVVRKGAELLDKWARSRHGAAFAGLDANRQDEILHALARAEIPVKSFPQKELFALLHTLTLEGFLSDPVHGGNADMIGWKTIGFEEPHLRQKGAADGHGPHHLPVSR